MMKAEIWHLGLVAYPRDEDNTTMSVLSDTSSAFACLVDLARQGFDAPETAITTILAALTTHMQWQLSFVARVNADDDQISILAAHRAPGSLQLGPGSIIVPASDEMAFWQGAQPNGEVTRLTAPVNSYAVGMPIALETGAPWGLLVALAVVPPIWTAEQAMVMRIMAQRVADEITRQQQHEHHNAMKGDFVSIVSHEFRTALMSILGFSQMLRDEPCSPTEIKEFATDIHSDATRISRMITDMLDLDRIESGHIKLTLAEIDLAQVLRNITSRFITSTASHTFRLQLDSALPHVVADGDKVVQMLANLVTNAIKYSPQGGEIVIGGDLDGGMAHLWVRDQGMGVPTDALEHIFERYSRVEAKTSRYIQGTGLGLPIVRQLAKLHGGHAWAESVPGHGSTFHVTLPLPRQAVVPPSLVAQ